MANPTSLGKPAGACQTLASLTSLPITQANIPYYIPNQMHKEYMLLCVY